MFAQLILLFAATRFVAADGVELWLGEMCSGASEGATSPMPLGQCIEFGQAESFTLQKDDGNVYNLYGGGGCAQYVGQVQIAGCSTIGPDATAIMNIGPQSAKRWIRGANGLGESMVKRVDGDTYQCPNIPSGTPYFFVVQSASTTQGRTLNDEDTRIQNDFVAAFNAAYQNPNGQTQVQSATDVQGPGINDVAVTLTMESGVIQNIQVQDIPNITSALTVFRDQENAPNAFLVSLYTGFPDHPDAGPIAQMYWNGL